MTDKELLSLSMNYDYDNRQMDLFIKEIQHGTRTYDKIGKFEEEICSNSKEDNAYEIDETSKWELWESFPV